MRGLQGASHRWATRSWGWRDVKLLIFFFFAAIQSSDASLDNPPQPGRRTCPSSVLSAEPSAPPTARPDASPLPPRPLPASPCFIKPLTRA